MFASWGHLFKYVAFVVQSLCLLALYIGTRPFGMYKFIQGIPWKKSEGFSSKSTSDDVLNQFGEHLNNKVIIMTGATSGIGKALILSIFRYWCKTHKLTHSRLSNLNNKDKDNNTAVVNDESQSQSKQKSQKQQFAIKKIIITYRNKEKLKKLEQEIKAILDAEFSGGDNETQDNTTLKNTLMKEVWLPVECDLASLESVDQFLQRVEQLNVPIDILINNAAVLEDSTILKQTVQGFEKSFGVNYIAPFYICIVLHKLFKRNLENNECKDGIRVIHVASNAHLLAPLFPQQGIRFGTELKKEEIKDPNASSFRPGVTHENYIGLQSYSESKLAMILHAKELNRRYLKENVNICCHIVHPGPILESELYRHHRLTRQFSSLWPLTKTCSQGAASILYAALHPALNRALPDQWILDCTVEKLPAIGFGRNATLAEKLWKYSLKRIKEQYRPIPG